MGAIVNLTRQITMRDTKSNIEANNADIEETVWAYATDTEEIGIYTNDAWTWFGSSPESVSNLELLVDEDGNILFDENNDVLYEG